jgi:hypothetical protein
MRWERGQEEGQDFRAPTTSDAPAWGQDLTAGFPWRTSGRSPEEGHPPDPGAFPVDWQLSPDEDESPLARQISRDEEARMFQRRLLRLYRVYYPPPGRP